MLLYIHPQLFYVIQGTLPFMSSRLLTAWLQNAPTVHTAVDDLESFLWVFVWVLVHILKKFEKIKNSTIDALAVSLSSYSITGVMARESIVDINWEDVVFGDLLQKWLTTSQMARKAVKQHIKTGFVLEHDVGSQQKAFDQFEEYCKTVYTEFIQTGYKHLESLRRYSDWNAVVEANPGWLK